jgi:hypothetical protein
LPSWVEICAGFALAAPTAGLEHLATVAQVMVNAI